MNDKLTEKTVQLDTPVMRGKTQITEIVLRKPQSGALRGTRLQAIMDMDVGAMMTVIPRISTPTLTAQEMAELDPADLTALSVEVVTFLLKKSVLAGLLLSRRLCRVAAVRKIRTEKNERNFSVFQ